MDIPDSYPASVSDESLQTEVVEAPKALGLVQRFTYKFPEYSFLSKRIESFNQCPENFCQDKKTNFALAGFYLMEYVGQEFKDCVKVRCFSCGLKLISNRGAFVLAYHTFISNKCQYLQMVIPTFRFNQIIRKFKASKKFYPIDSKQLLANNLLNEEHDVSKCCSVCLVRSVQVLFLPCQHLTCCRMCAVPLKKCPICRARIMASTFPIF